MDELWTTLRTSFQGLLDAHPLPVIAVVLFGEELGIPMPIPGDLLMILAGVRVAEGRLGLSFALLVQELATATAGGPATPLVLTEAIRWLAFALALGEFLPLAAREYDAGAPWSRRDSPS